MLWILNLALMIAMIAHGIRRERGQGLWSWSKFVFALGFAGLELVILIGPTAVFDTEGPYFWWIYATSCTVAVLNFIPFIILCRRWKLPDGRTSLQAYRDAQRQPPSSAGARNSR